jgi:urate oxidase
VTAREIALDPAAAESGPSGVLFRSTRADGAIGQVSLTSANGKPEVTAARSGWEHMRLVKTTGSSFAAFARDSYTTLPELVDRPLTIALSVYWRYRDLKDGVAEGTGFLGPRAVRDEIERTFHEFNSRSIQHLVHEIGQRLLSAHPQLHEIEFVAENRTPDHVAEGPAAKVFAEPRGTFGKIGLILRR